MQNVTPISATVAEISVTRQIHRITADLISDKTHTGVEFVDNDLDQHCHRDQHRTGCFSKEIQVHSCRHHTFQPTAIETRGIFNSCALGLLARSLSLSDWRLWWFTQHILLAVSAIVYCHRAFQFFFWFMKFSWCQWRTRPLAMQTSAFMSFIFLNIGVLLKK